MKKGIYLLGLGVLLLLCMDLQAKVRLPHFFSSNMVLQRDMPIRVWGKADKNEVISVALNGSVQTAKTGKDGIWRVELPAMKAGGTLRHADRIRRGDDRFNQYIDRRCLGL